MKDFGSWMNDQENSIVDESYIGPAKPCGKRETTEDRSSVDDESWVYDPYYGKRVREKQIDDDGIPFWRWIDDGGHIVDDDFADAGDYDGNLIDFVIDDGN